MTFGARARVLFSFSENFKLINFSKKVRTKKNVTLFLLGDRYIQQCCNFPDSPRGMHHLNFTRSFSKTEL